MTKKQKLLALIPPLWASIFDIAITIVHQPAEYWSGELTQANEGNPIGSFFMSNHISGIFIISIVWIGIVIALGCFLPRKIGRIFLLFVVIAHSFGASTWLSNRYSFWYAMIFILFNCILFYVIDDKIQSKNNVS